MEFVRNVLSEDGVCSESLENTLKIIRKVFRMMKQTERDKFMYRDKVIFFAAVAVFHHFG